MGHKTWDIGHRTQDSRNGFISFEKLGGGGGWVHLDYNVSSGPFFEF